MKDPGNHGLSFQRVFTDGIRPVFDQFVFEWRSACIHSPDGSVVFEQREVEVPVHWSQTATDILAQKYFRKSGVPAGTAELGGENSIKQVVHRMAFTWRHFGQKAGYFRTTEDADVFYDELVHMLLDQAAAPNSPQWFNTGLYQVYGITGPPQGHYHIDPLSKSAVLSTSAYEYPQPHACFILSVKDDLVNPGGIMDLFLREARIFKYGSGVGTNFSAIRSKEEQLSGGGYSSGLLSFLKVGDSAAGAIRSGGTTRRAAKMVCLDMDHPEIRAFIRWKMEEERKVDALVAAGYDGSFEGEAYRTVSGQNSNNSVRVPESFMRNLLEGGIWQLTGRVNGHTVAAVPASELWNEIASAAWHCGDPGVQFDTTINEWNTCPGGGRIRASNPCAEYMFLDDTACNLASLNLMKFIRQDSGQLDIVRFRHACRLWTVVLDISVSMAQYPSREVAENSFAYRTIGLGLTNLGAVLMHNGWPYDSRQARGFAAGVAALMTGSAYAASAELAAALGAFTKYAENAAAMSKVVRNHRAVIDQRPENLRDLSVLPAIPPEGAIPVELLREAREVWDTVCRLGERYGFRNAQVSVIAPTGTIGLVMDCDTTGIEPEYSLLKTKKLSGGGTIQLVNRQVAPSLERLGFTTDQIASVLEYLKATGQLQGAPGMEDGHLAVFACAANGSSEGSPEVITVEGHLSMLAAVQPFITGAISKTVNLPATATVGEVADCFRRGWELGLKALAVYRNGSKRSQPLTPDQPLEEVTPLCVDCGFRTQRAGTCYKCDNCGATTACS